MAEDTKPIVPIQTGNNPGDAPDINAPSTTANVPPSAPGAPATPSQPAAPAAPDKPGFFSNVEQGSKHVLGDIFQTLAGGKKKEWVQTDKGPVAQYRDLKPGEMARGILAAALTGLASGYDPANRGRGPAMSAAFSAGFKGEEEAKNEKAGKEEKEAQQQFQNEGVAQERMLALHRDARDQQRSLEQSSEHVKIMQETDQRIARNEVDSQHTAFEWDAKQEAHMQDLKNLGATPIMVNGKPLEFTNHNDAVAWANAHPDQAVRPGNFDTTYEQDPTTGRWSVWQKPKDRNRPQWMGVAVDSEGNPVRDKDGKMTIDKARPFYGMDGRPAIPAERMTPQEFYDRNEKTIDMRSKRLLNEAKAEELSQMRLDRKEKLEKDQSMKIARQHLDSTNGDMNATDKNGNLVLTESDRDVLMHELRNDHSYYGAIMDSGIKELQNMTTDDPNRAKIQSLVDNARSMLGQEMYRQAMFEQTPNNVEVIAQRVSKKLMDPKTGKVDMDAVKKELGPDIPKPLVDKVLDRIKEGNKVQAVQQTPDALAQKGLKLANISFSGPTLLAMQNAGLSLDDIGNKIRPEINALKTTQERAEYINKLNVPQPVKDELLKSSASTEKTVVNKTPVMSPQGQIFYATDEQLTQALAAGGVIVPEPTAKK